MKNNRNERFCRGVAARNMIRVLLAFTALAATTAFAQENTGVTFRGGIGVIPVTGVAANGTVNLNVVRGVSPGAPWRIADLEATVDSNGHIKVVGRGLLLATGNGVGTNAGQAFVPRYFAGPLPRRLRTIQ